MKPKSTIKKSQLESLVTMITKTLLNEIHEGKYINGLDTPEDYTQMMNRVNRDYHHNISDPNYKNYKRTDPRDSVDQDGNKLSVPIDEESATSVVAPVNGKLPISKRVMENDEDTIPGRFVNRGEIKLEGGINQQLADKIAHYHWDIIQSMGKNERGTFDYKTRGDRYCCTVGLLSGQPAILSVTTEPGRLNLLVGNTEIFNEESLEEISCASSAGAYNIPAAFSKREGGSSAAMKGSKSLGYELTPQGKQDFNRKPDAMTE